MSFRTYLEALHVLKPSQLLEAAERVRQQLPTQSEPAIALTDPSLGDFEVNMMEPLVGWKAWKLYSNSLYSPSNSMLWPPDCAAEGQCRCRIQLGYHSCGIYAKDNPDRELSGYGPILGQVYGWGRYIRGSEGWRAQFAYPKCFYLTHQQGDLIEVLKKYHVPIFIYEPLKIYDPEEEGYSSGYGQGEEEGHCGTLEDSDTDSEGDTQAG